MSGAGRGACIRALVGRCNPGIQVSRTTSASISTAPPPQLPDALLLLVADGKRKKKKINGYDNSDDGDDGSDDDDDEEEEEEEGMSVAAKEGTGEAGAGIWDLPLSNRQKCQELGDREMTGSRVTGGVRVVCVGDDGHVHFIIVGARLAAKAEREEGVRGKAAVVLSSASWKAKKKSCNARVIVFLGSLPHRRMETAAACFKRTGGGERRERSEQRPD
ncbi:hypothetical protein B7463_g10012, partial [Scytalidium lignicola]